MYLATHNRQHALLEAEMARFLAEAAKQAPPGSPLTTGFLVAHLLDLWYRDDARTETLRRLLLTHLRRLRPEDAPHLTASHYERLCFELSRRRNDPYLVTAILVGLTGLGDRSALSLVRPLAEGRGSAVGQPQVQEAARTYLANHEHHRE